MNGFQMFRMLLERENVFFFFLFIIRTLKIRRTNEQEKRDFGFVVVEAADRPNEKLSSSTQLIKKLNSNTQIMIRQRADDCKASARVHHESSRQWDAIET